MTYKEKLRDPRWQRRRLEILQQAGFECEMCTDKTTELHVHHLSYRKGLEPWEYKNYELVVLCKNCHEFKHLKGLPQYLVDAVITLGCDPKQNGPAINTLVFYALQYHKKLGIYAK